MTADQIKQRVEYYDAILMHWQRTLDDFPDWEGGDELRIDIRELEAHRDLLAERAYGARRKEIAARRRNQERHGDPKKLKGDAPARRRVFNNWTRRA